MPLQPGGGGSEDALQPLPSRARRLLGDRGGHGVGDLLAEIAKDVPLAGEVGEEGALADVGGLGDVRDRDVVEAALDEQPYGLGEDPLPGLRPPPRHSLTHGFRVDRNLTVVNKRLGSGLVLRLLCDNDADGADRGKPKPKPAHRETWVRRTPARAGGHEQAFRWAQIRGACPFRQGPRASQGAS